jgi:hypothetical protein
MNKENQLRRGILASVSVNKIDLTNSNNAFTIWTASPGGETFCGGRATLQDARALARQYVRLRDLVILPADPTKDLVPIADADRDNGTPPPPDIPRSDPLALPDFEAIRADTQRSLFSFLQAALKAGFIVVQSARLVKNGVHTDRFIAAKRSATNTAESVKRVLSLVKDVDTRTEIENRLHELERLISAL